MLTKIAIVLGVVLILAGVLGFIPQVSPKGMLLGIFHVNVVHNLIHLASGIISFWVGMKGARATQVFFQIFGLIYLFVGVLGFLYGMKPIFGMIANNMADTWLHIVIGASLIYLGFFYKGVTD